MRSTFTREQNASVTSPARRRVHCTASLRRQPIKVRSLDLGIAVTAQHVPRLLIAEHKDQIGAGRIGGGGPAAAMTEDPDSTKQESEKSQKEGLMELAQRSGFMEDQAATLERKVAAAWRGRSESAVQPEGDSGADHAEEL